MSIFKTVFIFALVLAIASARQRQRQRGRSSHRQRGRQIDPGSNDAPLLEPLPYVEDLAEPIPYDGGAVADAAATPEAIDGNIQIGEAIDVALENHDIVAEPEALSPPEAQDAGTEIVDNLAEAVAVAADAPQYLEIQPEVVKEQVAETHDDLDRALNLAIKHQKKLEKYGTTMTVDEVIQNQAKLLKYLELALHYSQQHDAAVQQDKALEDGAPPAEAVAVAEEVKATGRAMAADAKAKGCQKVFCGGIGR